MLTALRLTALALVLLLAPGGCSDSGGSVADTGTDVDPIGDSPDVGFEPSGGETGDASDTPPTEDAETPEEDTAVLEDTGPEPDVDPADTTGGGEDVAPVPTGSVEGVVWLADGSVAPDVAVSFIGAPDAAGTMTDHQGFFLLEDVPVGEQLVLAGPTALSQAAVKPVTVEADAKANAGIIVLADTGAVEGVVDAIGLEAGAQAGATVAVAGLDLDTTTGPSGIFQLIGVPAYCADLLVTRDGFQPATATACVEPGATTDVGTITLYPFGVCIPDCDGKVCGSDGCEGSCGECEGGLPCEDGQCVAGGECGDGLCEAELGESCGNCVADCGCGEGEVCGATGCCAPDCSGAQCGDDGCGGSCGECESPLVCEPGAGLCVLDGGTCGNGLCTAGNLEDCITCTADCGCGEADVCLLDGSCCTPACEGAVCGEDGCGGSCGTCAAGDCVEGQCVFICPEELPEPATVDGPFPTAAGATTATTTGSGFTDTWLVGDQSMVAVRSEWGGSIVYFGPPDGGAGATAGNLVDASNAQRAVRIALFDPDRAWQGCAAAATCAGEATGTCAELPPFLGWNPRLGANECGSLPGVDVLLAVPAFLETSTLPLFWNPDWAQATCANTACLTPGQEALASDVRYTQRLRFVQDGVVELRMTVQSLSATAHVGGVHELPALFGATGALGTDTFDVVVDASGAPVTVGEEPVAFESAGWAALQRADLGAGVGIVYETGLSTWGASAEAGAVALHGAVPFDLPPGATVETRAYLVQGSADDIEAAAEDLAATAPPFGEVETPAPDATLTGTIEVSGWVLDNTGVAGLDLLVDGEPVPTSRVDLVVERPEICARWPGYPSCGVQGFTGGASLDGISPCAHILQVRATDLDGNQAILGEVRFTAAAGPPCEDATSCNDTDTCTVDACDPLLGCVWGPKPADQLTGEFCNTLDDDCDGLTDDPPAVGCIDYYEDVDIDGFGVGDPVCLCTPTAPWVALVDGDCDDEVKTTHPFAPEACNEADDDCDDEVDEGEPTGCTPYWVDADEDGWGAGDATCACEPLEPPWTATADGDCDDDEPLLSPSASETCSGLDDNCDGATDPAGFCPDGAHAISGFVGIGGDHAVATPPDDPGDGYTYQGVAFLIISSSAVGLVPLYQSYSGSAVDHQLHISAASPEAGYGSPQLLGWCAQEATAQAPNELVRFEHALTGDHTIADTPDEAAALEAAGYEADGTLCFVP